MTNPHWTPCEVGWSLYQAAQDEDIDLVMAQGEGLYTAATRPAFWAWREHREHCENCQSFRKVTK